MEQIVYRSPYGWCLLLPQNWSLLTEADNTVVFKNNDINSLSMTWLCTPPVDNHIAAKLRALMMAAGPIDPLELMPVLQRIFPTLGKIMHSEATVLPDRSSCLRIEDSFIEQSSKQLWRGLQVISPIAGNPLGQARFQRLAFFAEGKLFDTYAKQVSSAMNSFVYEKPFCSIKQFADFSS